MTNKIVRLSAHLGVLFCMGLSFAVQADNSVQAARAVMDDFMRTFNARDDAAWADTLLFPHVRVASGAVRVDASKAALQPGDGVVTRLLRGIRNLWR